MFNFFKKMFNNKHEQEVAELKKEIREQSLKTDLVFLQANRGLNLVIKDINKAMGGK